jgi:hypothetical protein
VNVVVVPVDRKSTARSADPVTAICANFGSTVVLTVVETVVVETEATVVVTVENCVRVIV